MWSQLKWAVSRLIALSLLLAAVLSGPTLPSQALAQPRTGLHRVSVVTFNIKFLGSSKIRDNAALVDLLADFDLILIQELVAPPYPGRFPDGTPYQPDPEAKVFFDLMAARGFKYVLSEEDTGTGPKNHTNGTATEWFVAFYRPSAIKPAPDLFTGFLADDRTDHPDYERVPYAFGFRAGSEDLVFISVHLQPNSGPAYRARRAQELEAIHHWIGAQPGPERDYVILGDMNIQNCAELGAVLPRRWTSLNGDCRPTNTSVTGPKPYDHIMRNIDYTTAEIPQELEVISLVDRMRPTWRGPGPYPGDPYVQTKFEQVYSDHNPVTFGIVIDGRDDD